VNSRALLDRLTHGQLANVRFRDAQRLVEALGLELDRVQESQHIYRHPLIGQRINLQAEAGMPSRTSRGSCSSSWSITLLI
jgi:hypothetical protein